MSDRKKNAAVAAMSILIGCLWFNAATARADTLAQEFQSPPPDRRLYVWWHWMGYTISRYGIKRDLYAMKKAGVAGATICPIGSQAGVAQNITNAGVPRPVVYWSPRFWRLVQYSVKIAHHLHLKLGMENCPGWDASGGPWITPKLSMKMLTSSVTIVHGPGKIHAQLKQPPTRLNFYRPIEVLALPDSPQVSISQEIDISADVTASGELHWNAPAGRWRIYRIGYTSTASTDHPVPDSLVGPHGTVHSLEADKLSVKAATFHIEHVIRALQRHLGSAVGHTFNHLLFDSYEAGPQNWTKHFQHDFLLLRHYDPLPWLPVLSGAVIGNRQLSQRFRFDMARTVSQLFVQKDFDVYHKLINAAHMQMCLEPYTGPFNTIAAANSCDVTMGEFWNGGRNGIASNVAGAARAYGRTIVGAETLTGGPQVSRMTETPYIIKKTLDGGFLSGVNKCYLHDWTEQALNKRYRPGVLMGWWGTHFGENQTWFKPGIALFTYINRCQTMLQQGSQVCQVCTLNFSPQAFSIDALSRSLFQQAVVKHGKIILPDGRAYSLLLLPDTTSMLPSTAVKLQQLVAAGATVIGPRPTQSPSLTNYPRCDAQTAAIGRDLWGNCNGTTIREHHYGKGLVAWNVPVQEILRQLKVRPIFRLLYPRVRLRILSAIYAAPGHGRRVNVTAMLRQIVRDNGGTHIELRADNAQFGGDPAYGYYKYLTVKYEYGHQTQTVRIHENNSLVLPSMGGSQVFAIERRTNTKAIYFVANRSGQPAKFTACFGVGGRLPELWNPDTGERVIDDQFTSAGGRTDVPIHLGPWGSVFVVFSQPLNGTASVAAVARNGHPVHSLKAILKSNGSIQLIVRRAGHYQISMNTGRHLSVQVNNLPKLLQVHGPWVLKFAAGWGAPSRVVLPNLVSWTDLPLRDERYFSGTATYSKSIHIAHKLMAPDNRIILHLGQVDDLARIWVNGHDLGVVWYPPFSINITSAIKPGRNRLRIAVTNTWVNRLIGDEPYLSKLGWGRSRGSVGRPLKKYPQWIIRNKPFPSHLHTFTTWNYYHVGSHLQPAGLRGPVTVSVQRVVTIPSGK